MSIRLETLIRDETGDCYLCFRHAVVAAAAGHEIKLETDQEGDVDQEGEGNDLRNKNCPACENIAEIVEEETEKLALKILKSLKPGV